MQRGYYSLLVKDYSPEVHQIQVYSSEVCLLSKQKQVTDHLRFALGRVRVYWNLYTINNLSTIKDKFYGL